MCVLHGAFGDLAEPRDDTGGETRPQPGSLYRALSAMGIKLRPVLKVTKASGLRLSLPCRCL